jgi:nucleotide-binding universal stress UspA family protein
LVAVVRRDRGLLGRLFKGSHSKRMALHTSVPLLVLHEQD